MKTWEIFAKALETHGRVGLVTVVRTEGSAPRDAGARLIVTPEGFHGTIGGGTLEWRAIAEAQAVLDRGPAQKLATHLLGPELGQCCGGRVELLTEVMTTDMLAMAKEFAAREAKGQFTTALELLPSGFAMRSIVEGEVAPGIHIENRRVVETFGGIRRRIYLFGAGHVGKALVLALAPLPFDVHWIDARPGAFPGAVPRNVTLFENAGLREAPEGSFVFIMSHSHALDLALTDQALRNPKVAQVGLIGSATKRARFLKRLKEAGIEAARTEGLICPIGIPGIRSKEPAMIAAATVAQILVLDEASSLATQRIQPQHEKQRAGGRT